jgi:hypothetical protein
VIAELAHLISVLRGRIPHHLVCNLRGCERREISHQEKKILLAHGCLLCPCGGSLHSVHPALSPTSPRSRSTS